MSKQTIYINKKRVVLEPAQLIQSGGEGMVFDAGQGTVIKLYHNPQPQHAARLTHFMQSGLLARLPAGVMAPQALAHDRAGKLVGYQMARLPVGAQAIKRLAVPLFWQKHGLATAQIVPLFLQMHRALADLHQLGLVVGDLNDQNVHFAPDDLRQVYWLDVDSYQTGPYPCPVAALPFLDPVLYGVSDFGQRPYFTPDTDWYAYFVLLVKSLLHVHPYGGTHKQHKSLQARAQAGVTLVDDGVTYPNSARPPEALSDELLHHLHNVFARGQRGVFPAHLLAQYAADLTMCTHCGLAYPRQRRGCPACHCQTPAPQPLAAIRELLRVDGVLELVRVLGNGRILAISRSGGTYSLAWLGVGGTVQTMTLFDGRPGYRFAIFQPPGAAPLLAVNPPGGAQLLLLDVGGAAPRKLALLETGVFRETAVFAATPAHLYRIAGSWIMRGTLRDGLFVEDAIATAHHNQTIFWASPYAETLAGYHRVFAEHRYFLWHEGASFDVALPPLQAGESVAETAVTFDHHFAAFSHSIGWRGRQRDEVFVVDRRGGVGQRPLRLLPDGMDVEVGTAVHLHPQGILLQKSDRLHFFALDSA
ncbi:MAG: hypothetical protein H6662_03570 [Ardenticatenaceae bacterium]|nr:hypothetical protein [Anaerolineales bacterium]MCB8920641.1 hypothetical protein [Ardenticatenaceae bacterium]MCB9002943.1 hypothetical protein [Ardenticatenaceae bacterium]